MNNGTALTNYITIVVRARESLKASWGTQGTERESI